MDFTTVIKTVAPWIGTALGGPLGGLAVEAAANALGLSEKTTDAVKAAIGGATPEQMLALKKADQDFQVQMQSLGFKQIADLETIAMEDRKSARDMQVATKSIVPALLSALIVGGFLGMVWYVLSGQVTMLKDPVAAGMIGTLIGYVSAKADQVVSYYFGSSADSHRKTELIAQAPSIR